MRIALAFLAVCMGVALVRVSDRYLKLAEVKVANELQMTQEYRGWRVAAEQQARELRGIRRLLELEAEQRFIARGRAELLIVR